MELSEKLQRLRKGKQLTQEQLADALCVSRTAISKWESGRGYPSIDSLQAISKLFGVSLDDLLSGSELVTIAEVDRQVQAGNMRNLVFGVFDCMLLLLFFLPFFGQPEGDGIRHVSLLALETKAYLLIPFVIFTALSTVFGIVELGLQNVQRSIWLRSRTPVSLSFSIFGTILFMISPQPYAAVFVFFLLVMKAVLLLKCR